MLNVRQAIKSALRRVPPLERCAANFLNRRYQVAKNYLRGTGVEIGALHSPLILPKSARAFYVDRLPMAQLRKHYPELRDDKFFLSLVADGETLAPLKDESLDFLVANHMIEHCEDPMGTLKTFYFKLKPGGVLFMAVPDMRRTFDRQRVETPWEHVLDDHTQGESRPRSAHYLEWAEKVNDLSGDDARQRAKKLEAERHSIHFHCWTKSGFETMLANSKPWANFEILESVEHHNENIFVLRKN